MCTHWILAARMLRPGRAPSAVSQAWPGHVAGMHRPYRGPLSTVSRLCRAVSWPWHGAWAPCHRPCAARRVARRIVELGVVSRTSSVVSWRSLRYIVAPPPAVSRLSCDTTQRLALRAHTVERPCAGAGRVVASPDRIVACLGHIVATPACTARLYCGLVPLLCHDTMHCIVTQARKMGSSPFQHQKLFFFFTHIFFSLFVHLLEDPQKKYLFIYFSFSSRTKNIFLNIFFLPYIL